MVKARSDDLASTLSLEGAPLDFREIDASCVFIEIRIRNIAWYGR